MWKCVCRRREGVKRVRVDGGVKIGKHWSERGRLMKDREQDMGSRFV